MIVTATVTKTVTWNVGCRPLSAGGALNEDSDDKQGGHGYKLAYSA